VGITNELQEMIRSGAYLEAPEFSERERAVILWAEHVTNGTASARDDIYERVRAHLSETELVELTMTICYFNMRNKFNDAMNVPIEERDYIERSLDRRKDPAQLKAYLEAILAEWPEVFPQEKAAK